MAKIVPLTFAQHGKKHLLPVSSYAFAARQTIIPAVVAEFSAAMHTYPILFAEHKGEAAPFLLMGLAREENLFVDSLGKWRAGYIPATVRRYPFIFVQAPKTANDEEGKERLVLCIDEESGLLADEGGAPLFTEDGKRTPIMEKLFRFLGEYHRSAQVSRRFAAVLKEKQLLTPFNLRIDAAGDKNFKLEGLQMVNEKRLGELSGQDYLALKPVMGMIYAHLLSLGSLNGLVARKKAAAAAANLDQVIPDSFHF